MRIVMFAPWSQRLAVSYAESLRELGHSVLIVTTDRYFDPLPSQTNQVTLRMAGGRRPLADFSAALTKIRRFRPQLILSEDLTDPLLLALSAGALAPRLVMIHDPAPHDHTHSRGRVRRLVQHANRTAAAGYICFSDWSVTEMSRNVQGRVWKWPLVSEMAPSEVLPSASTTDKVFSFVGRLAPYKGLSELQGIWSSRPESLRGRSIRLEVLVSNDANVTVPSWLSNGDRVEASVGRYTFRRLAELLASTTALLLPYRTASQSGVQLTGLQCGVPTLCSDVGAMGEFQPEPDPAMPLQRVDCWHERMSVLLHDGERRVAGRRAEERYKYLADTSLVLETLDRTLQSFGRDV